MSVGAFLKRVMRAARLEADLYEEVEADRQATGQALLVILISGLASGIGSATVRSFAQDGAVALAGWMLWAFVTCQVGTRLLPQDQTRSDLGELLRVTGFSAAPGWLRVFGVVPALNRPVFLATGIWMVATMIVAIRQALDYSSTGRAVVVAILGLLILFGLGILLGNAVDLVM